MTNNYETIKDGDRYTIGEYNESYKAFIINDGICQYYWWDTEEEAQEAADALNAYGGLSGLGDHGSGYDKIYAQEWLLQNGYEADDDIDDILADEPDFQLYKLFHAVDYEPVGE